ncbi:MAG: hypothetical protein JW908_10180 [Anaerolineales bacterium]|nr:hypothetical protein [Anaerolineales bacterium]
MNDKSDQFIQQCIKNWAAQQQPPSEIRSRVLFAASPLFLKVMNDLRVSENSNKTQNLLTLYRSRENGKADVQERTQLWAWNMMTMSAPRFIA